MMHGQKNIKTLCTFSISRYVPQSWCHCIWTHFTLL